MLSTLKNLFISQPLISERPVTTPQRLIQDKKREKRKNKPVSILPKKIDAAFYGLILGVQSPIESTLNQFEKSVLRELDQLLASDISHNSLVPRLPAVIPQVMGTLRDQSSSSANLASMIGRDAVLVGEVIRLANSPYYGVEQKITTLERAVFALGRVGVRQLVANAAFKPLINFNSGHFTKLSGTVLWDQSEKAAMACDCMAKQEKADRFAAYLMAIVQNVGLTVALRILDRNFDGSHAPNSGKFHEQLFKRSRVLSLVIAREWRFPESVLEAIESQLNTKDCQTLGKILYVGDKYSKMYILSSQGRLKGDLEQVACRFRGRLTDTCKACFESLSD